MAGTVLLELMPGIRKRHGFTDHGLLVWGMVGCNCLNYVKYCDCSIFPSWGCPSAFETLTCCFHRTEGSRGKEEKVRENKGWRLVLRSEGQVAT